MGETASPIDKLSRTVERGFAAIAEDLTEMKGKIATKDDILRIEGRLLSIEQELKDIKRRLSELERKIDRIHVKYREDIEELWKRVIAIEKKLKQRA